MSDAKGLLSADRDFRWFWAGHSVSVVGSQVTAVALPLIAALTLDAGAAGVSVVAFASFLPNLVFSLLAGNTLERRAKRRVMIWMDAVRAGLLALVPLLYAMGNLTLPILVGVAFGVGTASVFFEISSFAYLPALVPPRRLGEANRAVQGSFTVGQVAGPGLAGLLVQSLGPVLALVMDAVSYLASLLGIAAARRPERIPGPPEERPGTFAGIRLLATNAYLRALTVYASVYNAASQILLVNLVIWAVQERDVGPGMYGVALSGWGLGGFVGTMAALRLVDRFGFGRTFAVSAIIATAVLLPIAALPAHGDALGIAIAGLLGIGGVGLGISNVLSATLRQTVIPPSQLARTVGGYRFLMYGSIPIGSALGGVLGETLGSRAGVAIATVVFATSALPMLSRRVRSIREATDARPPEAATTDAAT